MKKKISLLLILFLFLLGCSEKPVEQKETIKHLIFSAEELNQISFVSDGDMKYFSVPNKKWKIRAYLPDYNINKLDFAVFQASRHYDGEHMISVVSTFIDPSTGVQDLDSCLNYRKRLIENAESFSIKKENDRVVISKEDASGIGSKLSIVLEFYDGLCVDTTIITSQLSKEAVQDNDLVVDSIKVVPKPEFKNETQANYYNIRQAVKEKDDSYCLEISHNFSRDVCYMQLAAWYNLPEYCEKVQIESERGLCYYGMAIQLSNASLCNKILNYNNLMGDKESCKRVAAVQNTKPNTRNESILDDDDILNILYITSEEVDSKLMEEFDKIKGLEKTIRATNKYPLTTILFIEGEKWMVLLDLRGFKDSSTAEEDSKPPSAFLLKERNSDLMTISIFAEKITGVNSSESCRDHFYPSVNTYVGDSEKIFEMMDENIFVSELKEEDDYMLTYYVDFKVPGEPGVYKSINYYPYYRGYCFDFHISQVGFQGNMKPFNDIIKSIKFVEEVPPAKGENIYSIPPIEIE